MPQINSSDFRKGLKVIVDGDPYDMLECEFRKPGKGQAMYRTKLRNLLSGKIIDITYRSGDSLEAADVRRTEGQYLYRDANGYVFMDNETYEQDIVPLSTFEERAKFLLDGAVCSLLYWNGQLIDVDPPQLVAHGRIYVLLVGTPIAAIARHVEAMKFRQFQRPEDDAVEGVKRHDAMIAL